MTDLFAWSETAAPQPVWQGPPRPVEIVLASENGLDLIDRQRGTGWSARLLVEDTDSGHKVSLDHFATWGDFKTDEIDVGADQYLTAKAWSKEYRRA